MKAKNFVFFLSQLVVLPIYLYSHSSDEIALDRADDRNSSERNLYDENRARVDTQKWKRQGRFHPSYWTEDIYIYDPDDYYYPQRNYRYNPGPNRSQNRNPNQNYYYYYPR